MITPISTYRIQFSGDFRFKDLEEQLDYLADLGISTIYASPIFEARTGSTHGYDVINPFRINPEIGTLEEFRRIHLKLRKKKMSWIQDIVPNHMAYDPSNVWLQDVLELGTHSEFHQHFDIDWSSGRVMAPFFGEEPEDCLAQGKLRLILKETGFFFQYYEQEYPLSFRSYSKLTTEGWKEKFEKFNPEREKWSALKNQFLSGLQQEPQNRKVLEQRLLEFNENPDKLRGILELQFFEPAHWKTTEERINYRRFFTVNDLICLNMQKEEVFKSYHSFILELCREGLINGLRIDHIDGLFDPEEYLSRLRVELGEDFYIIIEKILEKEEKIPRHWPVQGTSGYGFLAEVNQLLTSGNSEKVFKKAYHRINPDNEDYDSLIYRKKIFILTDRMGGEYNNLWELLCKLGLLEHKSQSDSYKKALGLILAAFPVYRIYPDHYPLKDKQREIIEAAGNKAIDHYPELDREIGFLIQVLLGETASDRADLLYFLQRCQQFTGPLAAKGVEDTSFYIFNLLVSHNEVGDSPEEFGLSVKNFHQKMIQRQASFPRSLNTTATHDTKRGEDARTRINVLSEIPEEWFAKVAVWKEMVKRESGAHGPDPNEQYFIFQMLIGHWSSDESEELFLNRSREYLQKVLREAKEHSSWAAPDQEYEQAVFDYLKRLLSHQEFMQDFQEFHSRISGLGFIKSLSQRLLKLTAPGIPDIYQGGELWNLSYVDPDNRRPVDFNLRKEKLTKIKEVSVPSMKNKISDGDALLYILYQGLQLRKENPEFFEEASYEPLELDGEFSDSILGFSRKAADRELLVFVPILVTELFDANLSLKSSISDKKVYSLGRKARYRNLLSGKSVEDQDLNLENLFSYFPVAIYKNENL